MCADFAAFSAVNDLGLAWIFTKGTVLWGRMAVELSL